MISLGVGSYGYEKLYFTTCASYSGKVVLKIQSVKVYDYFRVFSRKVKLEQYTQEILNEVKNKNAYNVK